MKLLHLFNYCFKHKQGKMNWKNGRPKGTVKAVWQKTGMAIKKKKKKHKRIKFMYFINLRALSNGDLEGQTQALYYELT
jgi:hypothetical protein